MNWYKKLKMKFCCYSKCSYNEENEETDEEQRKRYKITD